MVGRSRPTRVVALSHTTMADLTNTPDAEDAMDDPGGYGKELTFYGVSTGLAFGAAMLAYRGLAQPGMAVLGSIARTLGNQAGEAADDGVDWG